MREGDLWFHLSNCMQMGKQQREKGRICVSGIEQEGDCGET